MLLIKRLQIKFHIYQLYMYLKDKIRFQLRKSNEKFVSIIQEDFTQQFTNINYVLILLMRTYILMILITGVGPHNIIYIYIYIDQLISPTCVFTRRVVINYTQKGADGKKSTPIPSLLARSPSQSRLGTRQASTSN